MALLIDDLPDYAYHLAETNSSASISELIGLFETIKTESQDAWSQRGSRYHYTCHMLFHYTLLGWGAAPRLNTEQRNQLRRSAAAIWDVMSRADTYHLRFSLDARDEFLFNVANLPAN